MNWLDNFMADCCADHLSLHLKHRFDEAEDLEGFKRNRLLLKLVLFNSTNVDNAIYQTQKQIQLADNHLDSCNYLLTQLAAQ